VRPVVQRRRIFNEDKRLIIREETQKLLKADHITGVSSQGLGCSEFVGEE